MAGRHFAAKGLAALRIALLGLSVLLLAAASANAPRPMRGVALIIGNGAYEHLTPLTNPDDDADAIEKLFDQLGFETYDATDADLRKMRRTIDRFIEDAEGVDVALVYYAGHGIEAGGENYLVPVDADLSSLDDAADKLVPLTAVLRRLREVAPLSFVLLDACRDNPFPPGSTIRPAAGAEPLQVAAAGLGETRAVKLFKQTGAKTASASDDSLGTLIGFAAEPGARALDGEPGSHSPYAAAVLRHVPAMAGEEISTVMRMVAEEVYLKTDGRQRPWVNENLRRLVYLGSAPPQVEGAEGDILRERRQLLVNIAALPGPERRKIEAVARNGGVTMDSVYGMFRALGDDAPQNPEELEKVLAGQVAKIKELESERAAIKTTDPEITRLAELADQATSEGAVTTALQLHEQAKARVEQISHSVDDAEADVKARRLEFADVYARSAKANFSAFKYEQAARDYEEAFNQVERWDDFSAWSYRGNQAVALMESGWKGGATGNLRKAGDLAVDIVALSEKLDDRANWAVSQTFLGNTLMTLGQRLNDQATIARAIAAYEQALTVYTQEDYPKERRDVLQNLAGATKQVAQRYEPARAKVEMGKAIALFDEQLSRIDRTQNPFDWASLALSKGLAMNDLARIDDDVPMLKETVALLSSAAEDYADGTKEQQSEALCALATAWSDLGVATRDKTALDTSDGLYARCIPLTNKAVTPVVYGDRITARALNLHNLYLQTDDAGWLDQCIPLMREARDMLDPEALPIEWRAATTSLGGALLDLGRARKSAAPLQQSIEIYAAALDKIDPAKEPEEVADNLSRQADARRNLGEITPSLDIFTRMMDDHDKALRLVTVEKYPALVADMRKRVSWISTATSRLGDKLPEDTAIALLQRGQAILERPQPDGPLAAVESELARQIYIKAIKTDDVAGLQQAIDLYRRSLVEDAKRPAFDTWRVSQSNLGLAQAELGRIRKDNKLIESAAESYRQAVLAAVDDKQGAFDRRRLAETYDKLGVGGDIAWLSKAAAAWTDATTRLPADATAADRVYVNYARAMTLQNLAYFEPGKSSDTLTQSIAAYRAALAARTPDSDLAERLANIRSLAELLRITGENTNDKARIAESVALYHDLTGPGRQAGPELQADQLSQGVALVALGRQGGDQPAFDKAVTLFETAFGRDLAAVPPSANWREVVGYAEALRQTGYEHQKPEIIRRSTALIAAYQAAQTSPLAADIVDNLAFNRAEGELFVGDIASDLEALSRAATIYDDLAKRPSATGNPMWLNYLNNRNALARLVSGDIADRPDDWRIGLTLIRDVAAKTPRADNPQAWAQNASDLAFAISRSARIGVTGDTELGAAVQMARDALAIYQTSLPDELPAAQTALATALIEQGRAIQDRAQVEEGLALLRQAITAKQAKSQTWTVGRMETTVAYAEDLLKKM